MRPDLDKRHTTAVARYAAIIVALCVLGLTVDYGIARYRAPRDDARILALQKQAQGDSKFAKTLAATHDEVTTARKSRKVRSAWLGNVLIAAAVVFLATSKWRIALDAAGNRPLPKQPLVQLTVASVAAPPRPAKDKPSAAPTPEPDFHAVVDAIVAKLGRTQEAAVPILHAIQEHYRYLPDAALTRVCEVTDIRPSQIAGTSSFYSRFRRSPQGEHVIRVCHGTACHVSGARPVTEELRRHLGIADGADTSTDGKYTIEEAACLGCCSLAPVLMVDERTAGRLTPATAVAALEQEQEASASS